MNTYFDSDAIQARVLLVDDERFVHDLVGEALKGACELLSVEDSEEAIMAISAGPPDLILLDVEMPGISGLDLCKTLRESPATANTPVIFLSGHEEITARVAGYAAGGDDYVTKPFSMRELRAKVVHFLNKSMQQRELKSTADFASSTAMTALSSMGEIGVLLEALKGFNATQDFARIAEVSIGALRDYSLHGAIQIRTAQKQVALNTQDDSSPIETAIIEKMIGMDRIFQFGNRLLISYEHVSLLISNLPSDDPARIGRLRDHLAMLAEGADVRVQAIVSAQESRQRGAAIDLSLARITEALSQIDVAQRNSRVRTSMAVAEMSENVGNAMLSVALSEAQEDYLSNVIREGVNSILDANAIDSNVQDKLSTIVKELRMASGLEESGVAAPTLVWSELLELGNATIDEDHKTLLMSLNQLYSAMVHADVAQITTAFDQLLAQARGHFLREEKMMKQSGFDGLDSHKAEHAALLRELESLHQGTLTLPDFNSDELFDHLKAWTLGHIMTFDRALTNHLAKLSSK